MSSTSSRLVEALRGRYEIHREIGRGGMATVYLARDLRHHRNVALKLLDPDLGAVLGAERFLSEIRVTANLQHPNLLPLFDSGEANGLLYYVMPFVEGETLRARLEREKQLPVEDAVQIAVAVAGALAYAHANGVIHRDLKPENILLHAGQPVVADFGIALAVSNAGGSRVTQTGLSLGTPQYMSPEQATGDRAIDGRTDIYSLGAVLYEMLAGDPPHSASAAQAVIAKVVTERPPSVRTSRPAVPEHVADAIECALEKLPADRMATATEFADALRGKSSARRPTGNVTSRAHQRRTRVLMVALPILGLAAGAILGATLWPKHNPVPPPAVAARFDVKAPGDVGVFSGSALALSPDGGTVTYVRRDAEAGTRLYYHAFAGTEWSVIPGTDGASLPFYSPDGAWLAFLTTTALMKVPAGGGTPTQVVPTPMYVGWRGASWGKGDVIVLGARGATRGLSRVAAAGGSITAFTKVDTSVEIDHRWPVVLDDGKTVLFTSWRGTTERSRLALASLATGEVHQLNIDCAYPFGIAAEMLYCVRSEGSVLAAPFDRARETTVGEPVIVASGVSLGADAAAKAAMSMTGSLVFEGGLLGVRLVTAGPRGEDQRPYVINGFVSGGNGGVMPRISPDGRKLALVVGPSNSRAIWVIDRSNGTRVRLTPDDSNNHNTVSWTPDGKSVLYRVISRSGSGSIWRQAVDGSSNPVLILPATLSHGRLAEARLTPDGRGVVYADRSVKTLSDIWYKGLTGDTVPRPLRDTPAEEGSPEISPDGRWLAYMSNESGTFEIYLTAFPSAVGRWPVSVGGGRDPVWSPDGKSIMYLSMTGQQLIRASVQLGSALQIAKTDTLFRAPFFTFGAFRNYDINPKDGHFIFLQRSDSASSLVAMVNLFSDARLARRVGR